MTLRAKFKFEADVFFMILLGKIMKNTSASEEYSAAEGGKRLFTALRAEGCFESRVIFTISRSEIVKMTRLSEEYSAAEGGKNLFTQSLAFG